jgi:hypothetical protein
MAKCSRRSVNNPMKTRTKTLTRTCRFGCRARLGEDGVSRLCLDGRSLDLRLQGFSYKNVIEKTGVSSSTVSRLLRKHSVLLAMDRCDDLYEVSCNELIDEHVQNEYLAHNLSMAERELYNRSFKALPLEKLQSVVRQLRSDFQKLQDKREAQLEKCQEKMERDAQKQKENKGQEPEDGLEEEQELAQIPIPMIKITFQEPATPPSETQEKKDTSAPLPKPAAKEGQAPTETTKASSTSERPATANDKLPKPIDPIKTGNSIPTTVEIRPQKAA